MAERGQPPLRLRLPILPGGRGRHYGPYFREGSTDPERLIRRQTEFARLAMFDKMKRAIVEEPWHISHHR